MSKKHAPLRGFKYYTALESQLLHWVRQKFNQLAEAYNIKIVNPPLLAKTSIFQSLGEASDVVKKELYSFTQRDGEEVCLIPEYTRIFVEQMCYENTFHGTFACFGPCFRYERPQLGRYRSFNQISIESIGSNHYMKDIELFCFLRDFLSAIGITDYKIQINSIGTLDDRKKYEQTLKEYFSKHLHKLSDNSKAKFEKKAFLRMLDSKDEEDLIYINKAPKITDFLCDESMQTFHRIKMKLNELNIQFEENPLLVRGLDYYNDLVFEYNHMNLGSQNALLGGGRYDSLFKSVGGPDVAAVGVGIGVERLIHVLEKNEKLIDRLNQKIHLGIIPIEETEYLYALEIFELLKNKVCIDVLYDKTVSQRLKICNKNMYEYVMLIGETERLNQNVVIKDMRNSTSITVSLTELSNYFNNEKNR